MMMLFTFVQPDTVLALYLKQMKLRVGGWLVAVLGCGAEDDR